MQTGLAMHYMHHGPLFFNHLTLASPLLRSRPPAVAALWCWGWARGFPASPLAVVCCAARAYATPLSFYVRGCMARGGAPAPVLLEALGRRGKLDVGGGTESRGHTG